MDKTRDEAAVEKGLSVSKLIVYGVRSGILVLCGYLAGLCALPFGAYPFGTALLAAAGSSAPLILAGLCGSALTVYDGYSAAVAIGVWCGLFLLRVLLRLTVASDFSKKDEKRTLGELCADLFKEPIGYRVCSAAIASLSLSFAFLAGGGFLYYDLFSLLICVCISPLACFILCGFFCPIGNSQKARRIFRLLGFLALTAICVRGGAPLKFYGVSLCVCAGMFLTLAVCKRGGILCGVLTAVAAGLAYSPLLAPVFLITALSYAAFFRIAAGLVGTAALFGSLFYSFYVLGIRALDGIVGGILTAVLLFSVYLRLSDRSDAGSEKAGQTAKTADATKASRVVCSVLPESELDSVRLRDINRRMSSLGEGFMHLSDFCEEMKLKFPLRAEIDSICAAAFECSCSGCSEFSRCRSGDMVKSENAILARRLESDGKVERSSFSEAFVLRCSRLNDIIDEINYNYSIRFGGDGVCERSDGFFSDGGKGYRAVSELLSSIETSLTGGDGISTDEEEYTPDILASRALCEGLSDLSIGIRGVIVYGKKRRRVYVKGDDLEALLGATEKIAAHIFRTLGFEMSSDGVALRRTGSKKGGAIELSERRKFAISSRVYSRSADGAAVCGDSVELFENCDGRSFCVMSDGMGSGRDAALTSELAVGFIKNMLSEGELNRELIGALNSFLRSRSEGSAHECSTTLDAVQIDLVNGRTTFFKCGAAPTYVYRNGNLFKLRSRTMPLGIIGDVDVKIVDVVLGAGDVVVMMSDGVTGGKEECPYLFDLLRQNIGGSGLDRYAELIVKYARAEGSEDDISVALMRIEDAG